MRPDDLLRVLVVEDEWVARNFLVQIIEATGLASVVGAVGAFDAAVSLLGSGPGDVDVVFVDIHLVGSEHDGLDLIRRFAAHPVGPTFVLATALREHALEAFEMGVVDYVLKPFDSRRIAKCLEKLHAARRSSGRLPEPARPPRIVARNKRNLVFLTLGEVWAIEASDGLTLLHCGRGMFDLDLSLDTIEASFGRELVRVHRNWLVSEEHVLELERDGGESAVRVGSRTPGGASVRVPVARDRAAQLRARLMGDGIGIRRR